MYSFLKPHFFLLFLTFSKYKYTLTQIQQKVFRKKLYKLFPNKPTFFLSKVGYVNNSKFKDVVCASQNVH